jgi:hypothetical protein
MGACHHAKQPQTQSRLRTAASEPELSYYSGQEKVAPLLPMEHLQFVMHQFLMKSVFALPGHSSLHVQPDVSGLGGLVSMRV